MVFPLHFAAVQSFRDSLMLPQKSGMRATTNF